ncbi:MAG: hypothetical protein ACD_63C00088G0001 [uncultured bacterium]|nr:MAG: hypothetical protein ACD_63C00088G0001 [uncultured bacterium]
MPSMDIAPKAKRTNKVQFDKKETEKLKKALEGSNKPSNFGQNGGSKKFFQKKFWKEWTKGEKAVFLVVLIAAASVVGFLLYRFYYMKPKPSKPEVQIEEKGSEGPMMKSPLTGIDVPTANAKQTPMMVIIENLSTVRPQSGMSKADIIYEFLAEGGITRFGVVFGTNDVTEPDLIGPVRSLRSYFIPISLELLAPVYHVGGAPNALERAREWGMRDVNQFFDAKYFWRDSAVNGQGSPHNVWTRMPETKLAIHNHWPTDDAVNIDAWKFKNEALIAERGNISNIIVPFSSGNYNVRWQYDSKKNRFDRFNFEEAHTDRNNKEQLTARNIVVQYCGVGGLTGDDKGRLEIQNDQGEGDALVFYDGKVIESTWKKSDKNTRTKFYKRGTTEEVEFIPGNFWIEVVPTDKEVTWEDGNGKTEEGASGEASETGETTGYDEL